MLFLREILEETLVFGLLLGVGLAFGVVLGLARIHWFYRAALPVAVAWLLLPTKMYPASIYLLLTAGQIIFGLAFVRWWQSRGEAGAPSNVVPRFTLRSMLLATGLIAAICGVGVIAKEDIDAVSQIGSSMASSAIVLAAAWASRSNSRKRSRLLVVVATLIAAPTIWHFTTSFDLFEMRSESLYLLGTKATATWLLCDAAFGVVLAFCTIVMMKAFYGGAEMPRWKDRVARSMAVSLAVVAVMLGGFFYYHLAATIPIPATVLPNPNGQAYFARAGESLRSVNIPVPGTDAPAVISQFVSDHGEALSIVRKGLELECRIAIVWKETYIADDLNRIQDARQVGRAFQAEASKYAEVGNYGQAAQSSADCIRFAHEMSRGGLQIHFLVAVAIEGIGTAELSELLPHLDVSACHTSSNHLLRVDDERESVREIQERDELWSRVSYGGIGRLQFAMRELFNRPAPFTNALRQVEQRNDAIRRLLVVELAVRAYTLEHATPPNQLGELVPEYLPSLPNDPYDAAPLRYLLKNNAAIIYSIGPDGDDDLGEGSTWSNLVTEGDGDIVLRPLFESAK